MSILALDSTSLCNIYLLINSPHERIKHALLTRATCKALKSSIDNMDFGIPFMQSFNINTLSSESQRILNEKIWMAVFHAWKHTPLTVAFVDYSNSMNGSIQMGGTNHLFIAQQMLSSLFKSQQQKLRTELVVYIFAKTFKHWILKTQEDLEALQVSMDTNKVILNRESTILGEMMEKIINSQHSIFNPTKHVFSFDIRIISDFDIDIREIKNTLSSLNHKLEKTSNLLLNFQFSMMPTFEDHHYQRRWTAAQTQWQQLNKRQHLVIKSDVSQSAKRVKQEVPKDLPPLPFDDLF